MYTNRDSTRVLIFARLHEATSSEWLPVLSARCDQETHPPLLQPVAHSWFGASVTPHHNADSAIPAAQVPQDQMLIRPAWLAACGVSWGAL